MIEKSSKNPKVKDHDHVTGLYRGPAHNECNLKNRREKDDEYRLHVNSHNLQGYDENFILKYATSEKTASQKWSCITSGTKVKSVDTGEFHFSDTLNRIPSSLARLADTLTDGDLYYSKQHFKYDILDSKKAIFP